jgi:acetyl-CoA carboxylase biotin carboxyl carrier protein
MKSNKKKGETSSNTHQEEGRRPRTSDGSYKKKFHRDEEGKRERASARSYKKKFHREFDSLPFSDRERTEEGRAVKRYGRESGRARKGRGFGEVKTTEARTETLSFDNQNITIEELVRVLLDNDLNEVEYEKNGQRIYLSKNSVGVVSAKQKAAISPLAEHLPEEQLTRKTETKVEEEKPEEVDLRNHPGVVKSPMVGVAYLSPSPGEPPFVKIGDVVEIDQTLLIIEAMKVLNPLKSTKNGKVIEIFVSDHTPVEYDEPLLVID